MRYFLEFINNFSSTTKYFRYFLSTSVLSEILEVLDYWKFKFSWVSRKYLRKVFSRKRSTLKNPPKKKYLKISRPQIETTSSDHPKNKSKNIHQLMSLHHLKNPYVKTVPSTPLNLFIFLFHYFQLSVVNLKKYYKFRKK
jgi:hypothetical protein